MPRHVSFASQEEGPAPEPPNEGSANQKSAAMIATNTRSNWLYAIIVFSTMALTSVWLVLSTNMPLPENRITAPAPLSHCGASAAEAAARGCHFDIMSFSWLPPACFDSELTREFESAADWAWYRDQNATRPVARAEVLRGERDLFVSARYHKRHCTFMWKKLHRAVAGGRPVDSYIGDYNHTLHCEGMLLMEDDAGAGMLNTRIFRKFPSCESDRGQLTA